MAGYMHGNQPKAGWEVADDVIRGEPVPGKVIPKQEKRFQVEMRISFPSDDPNEGPPLPKTSTYHWSSYAVDDNGNEVAELDYLQNFQKRYNKVESLTWLHSGLTLCNGPCDEYHVLDLFISVFMNFLVIIDTMVKTSGRSNRKS